MMGTSSLSFLIGSRFMLASFMNGIVQAADAQTQIV